MIDISLALKKLQDAAGNKQSLVSTCYFFIKLKGNLNMQLYLLKPDFNDFNLQPQERLYFCPSCATVSGMLGYYPQLRGQIEVIYVDFQRPRPALVELLGEANQSSPVLVLDQPAPEFGSVQAESGKWFINQPEVILEYLSAKFKVGFPHP